MREKGRTSFFFWFFITMVVILVLFLFTILTVPFFIDHFGINEEKISGLAIEKFDKISDDALSEKKSMWFKLIIWIGVISVSALLFYLMIEFVLRKIEFHETKKMVFGAIE